MQAQVLAAAAAGYAEVEQIIGCLEEFAAQVRAGLGAAEWATRRAIIRALVKSIELDRDQVYIVFRVGADPFELRPEGGIWQHCWRRVAIAFGKGGFGNAFSVLRDHGEERRLE